MTRKGKVEEEEAFVHSLFHLCHCGQFSEDQNQGGCDHRGGVDLHLTFSSCDVNQRWKRSSKENWGEAFFKNKEYCTCVRITNNTCRIFKDTK